MEYNKISNEEKFKRLGINIAHYRKEKGLTQLELAEMVDISRTHMGNIEAPKIAKPISLELAFNIADALEIPVYKLFEM